MKNVLLILIPLWLISFTKQDDCEIMKSGTFLVVTDSKTTVGQKIKIRGNKFEITDKSGHTSRGEFKWLDDCTFILQENNEGQESGNKIEKALNSVGPIYYQITEVQKDTLYFEKTRNLHIYLDAGKFIKLAD